MIVREIVAGLATRLERWGPALIVAAVLVLWETLARLGFLSAFFPAPTEIGVSLMTLLVDGDIVVHATITLARVLAAFVLGAGAGMGLGLVMGASTRLHALLDPLVALAHPIPKIAVLPLILVVFGIGETSKVALGTLGAFFPMLINTVTGVRQVSPTYFEVARSYGASHRRTFMQVVLPGSLPMVMTGARLSINVALMLIIAGELVVAQRGLGQMMWFSWQTMRITEVYAWLAVTSCLGVLLNAAIVRLSAWVMPWRDDTGHVAV